MQCVPVVSDFGVGTGIPARLEEGDTATWSPEERKLRFYDYHGRLKRWAERNSEHEVYYDDGRWLPNLTSADAVHDALLLLAFWSGLDVKRVGVNTFVLISQSL